MRMHHRHPGKARSKLKAFQTRQLTVCSGCTCLPLKCFQYARSLTSLLKSDCAAIDSLHSDKQLRPGLANQSITGRSLSPPHCVSLPLPPLFPCMLAKPNRRKNLKLLTTRMHRKAQFPRVLREGRRANRWFTESAFIPINKRREL